MPRSKRVKPSKAGAMEARRLEYFAAVHIRHAGNKPEWYGKPFYLEDFQRTYIWTPVFGTGRMERRADGTEYFRRRYRSALICMPRDFGKTELVCAMLLSEANMHPVHEGQYGIIAYDEDQAKKILRTLGAMIGQDPDMRALWDVGKSEIVNRETAAVVKVFPYSAGAVQSWHFNMLVADELHVWRDDRVWAAIVSGMSEVENSLLVAITTAGEERSGLLWDLLHGSEELACVFDDPTAYAWWLCAPDAADVDDERAWRKLLLPSWVTMDGYRASRRKLSRRNFERYKLNRWPSEKQASALLRPGDIRRCQRRESAFDFDRPFCLAIDGAVNGDAFALVAHQRDEDGYDQFHDWIYEEPPEDPGYYQVAQIGQLVAGICQRYRCPVGIDPARLLLWANELADGWGCEIYEIRQKNEIMCPATSLLENSVRSGRAALGGLDTLARHMGNCLKVEREPYGYRMGSARHGQGSARIDAAVAAGMAMWMTETMPPRPTSFAETGGVWSVAL